MAQAVELENLDVIVVEAPMVLKAALQRVLVVRASHSWEGEWVSSSLQMTVSVKFLKACTIEVELYLLTNLVSRGSHPHQD